MPRSANRIDQPFPGSAAPVSPASHVAGSPARTIDSRTTWRIAYLMGWLLLGSMLAVGARNVRASDLMYCADASFAPAIVLAAW